MLIYSLLNSDSSQVVETIMTVNSSPSKKRAKDKTTQPITSDYLEILGSNVAEPRSDDRELNLEDEHEQLIKDQQVTLDKAMKAASDGNADDASFLFRIHSRMIIPPLASVKSSIIPKTTASPTTVSKEVAGPPVSDEEPFVENGITFMPGHVPSTTTSILTPYFDKNIREFKGPIPLSIFDLSWQALAENYHSEKRVKTDDVKHNNYTGYPYPDDLTLDYGSWCINYRNFLRTFANPYGWHRFAKWGEIHRENVEAIRDASGWMVALRYDVKIRSSAFRMKCSNGTTEGAPDIRTRRKDIEEECYAEARRFNELGFGSVNPYAKGGERFDWNPRNGQPKFQFPAPKYSNYKSQGAPSNNQNSSYSTRGSFGSGSRGGGSKGNRYGYRGPPELVIEALKNTQKAFRTS